MFADWLGRGGARRAAQGSWTGESVRPVQLYEASPLRDLQRVHLHLTSLSLTLGAPETEEHPVADLRYEAGPYSQASRPEPT